MLTFILAGGMGTRLRGALDPSTPKPMAPIAGLPFLEYLVRQIRREGLGPLVLLTGHGAEVIARYFGTGAGSGIDISYSREEMPLGTGGAVRLAASRFPGERYLVMNGDTYFDIPLRRLISDHETAVPTGAQLTMALAHSQETARFGSVELDAAGSVSRFVEKEVSPAGLINAGIYVAEASAVAGLPADQPASLERDLLPRLVGHGLRGLTFRARFVDIGTEESYRALADAPQGVLSSVL